MTETSKVKSDAQNEIQISISSTACLTQQIRKKY